MRIRTQLILAFFLLSVLPLTGIVVYSDYSSRRAVRAAQQREAEEMARRMDRRVAEVRGVVGERLAALAGLPFSGLVASGGAGESAPIAGGILREMGDAAPFLESLEFRPTEIHAFHAPGAGEGDSAAGGEARTSDGRTTPPLAAPSPAMPAPPVPPVPPAPRAAPVVVIDVDKILRDVKASFERQGIAPGEDWERGLEATLERTGELAGKIAELQAKVPAAEVEEFERQMEEYGRAMQEWGEAVAKQQERARTDERARASMERSARVLTTLRRKAEEIRTRESSRVPAAPAPPEPRSAVSLREPERDGGRAEQTSILFGRELQLPVVRDGRVVGELRPRLRGDLLIQTLLGVHDRSSGEIPFAIDREGTLYAPDEPSRETIRELGLGEAPGEVRSQRVLSNWVVATARDEESGLTLGIARPIGEPLAEVRRAAGRNFAYGLGLIFVALIGIIPIANHMTRDVQMVTEGAERIAQGDLEVEVPVRSRNEFGTLAASFNRMAHDLREQQSRLLEQERLRKDEEIQRRLLAAEVARKSEELEDARRFQLSLLPKELPRVEGITLAVHMRTATEVGGDYYDFHLGEDGALTIALGDATGHGASAGTMVTIVKSLFSTYRNGHPGAFLEGAGETIRRMELGRMTMALLLARIAGPTVTLASAGMPPGLLWRARTRSVEEIAAPGMPLGSFDGAYPEARAALEPGDTLLLMSDGFPELLDRRGDPLGYVAVENAFRLVAADAPDQIIAALSRAADERTGGEPPNDDITFVVVKVA